MTIALAVAAYWVLPHADFPDYGKFAGDTVSHAHNVFSNLGLLVVGIAGVFSSRRFVADRAAALTLFAGVIATAFGSA
jgi:hypothetical protein